MFVDLVTITVIAGNGGNGCDSYYQRTDRKSVPHGGDGGKGGSVIFRADNNVQDLETFCFRQKMTALPGGHGGSEKKRGRNGEDLVVLVPPGTQITDKARGLLIRRLGKAGDEVVVAEGGAAGGGNQGGKPATKGEKGAEIEIELSLRIPADVFLVGMPNSGKSSLMNKLTRTRIKEEPYPFSTRQPELGVWKFSDYESLTLCELPSIYESSHEGKGLGSAFLKHLEGARHILYIVNYGSEFAESPAEGYAILRKELEMFSEELLEIPHAVVVNKTDLEGPKPKGRQKKFSPGVPVFPVSITSGEGLKEVQKYLGKILKEKQKEEANA